MIKQQELNRLLDVVCYIEQHIDSTLPLEHLAELANMSVPTLHRKFKTLFGITPKQFQNDQRIHLLKKALKEDKSITEAIYLAGFGSVSRVYEQTNAEFGMTLTEYKNSGENLSISYAFGQIDYGQMIMAATDKGVCFLHFGDNQNDLLQALEQEFPKAMLYESQQQEGDQLTLWLIALQQHIKHSVKASVNVPLHLFGTLFQLKVWRFLTKIGNGQKISYRELANSIGNANAQRAVANACGKNNVALLVPCHRVFRADGQVGGYRWGHTRKQSILEHEAEIVATD